MKKMLDERDAKWYEQQEQNGFEISEYQEKRSGDSALEPVPHQQASQHWNPHAPDMHPQEQRTCRWMPQHSRRCFHIIILTLHLLLRDRCTLHKMQAQQSQQQIGHLQLNCR